MIPRGQGRTRLRSFWNIVDKMSLAHETVVSEEGCSPILSSTPFENPCIQFLKHLLVNSWFFSFPVIGVIDLTNLLWL